MKGINFVGIKDAGDPIELATKYVRDGADELVFLDITATHEKRKTMVELVNRIAKKINVPFTVGGGINSLEDASAVIDAGADKISVNSAAVRDPSLISSIANKYGNQCVVVAIDIKKEDNGNWYVYTSGGRNRNNLEALYWAQEVEKRGAGEILLTSMNNDGTKSGFALEITEKISSCVNIPVIASGGAGKVADFADLFQSTTASAGLAASIFHYGEIPIPQLKKELKSLNISIR
ncbi:Imidazole glycerol phosphate synthase subunit HisF [Parvicella tangerina]|uniref:imidazole glycerol-phosphate synthase n=1 Tax=Parvicella tangerina TaxID=2829795 RepID=A0A916NRI5_9FLAO|nr:Imidazole glycerol phosphate synthase subunit HisF [Parvicella tangerina]